MPTAPVPVPVPEDVVDRLVAAGCVAADEEAEELVAAAPDRATLDAWLARREQGEPLAWITGSVEFCGRRLRVDPGVYVPRAQTEDLAHRAAALFLPPAAGPPAPTDLDAWPPAGTGQQAPTDPPAVLDAGARAVDRRPEGTRSPWGDPVVPPAVQGRGAPVEPARAALAPGQTGLRAVDLCTGAGAVAVHLRAAVPGAVVVGIDLDPAAVACARRNGVPAVVGDLAHPPLRAGIADLVTAVPPYVPTGEIAYLPADVQRYEPLLALDGGADGLDLASEVVATAARLLRPGGWLAVEVGADQDELLGPALAAAGFAPPTPFHDEDGDLRGLTARRP